MSFSSLQGSEEIFSVDPLPPRPSSADHHSQPMAYIPRSGSPQPMEQGERTRERDEDEMISGDVEEVSHFIFLKTVNFIFGRLITLYFNIYAGRSIYNSKSIFKNHILNYILCLFKSCDDCSLTS